MSVAGLGSGSDSQEIELNIASIIDCFTVLITFMLASASFLSIGILDAGIAAGAASPTNSQPPAVSITIELKANQVMQVKLSGKSTQSHTLNAKSGAWDEEGLKGRLTEIKSQWPDVGAVTVSAESAVMYKDVVKTMEITRKTHPAVLLGGF